MSEPDGPLEGDWRLAEPLEPKPGGSSPESCGEPLEPEPGDWRGDPLPLLPTPEPVGDPPPLPEPIYYRLQLTQQDWLNMLLKITLAALFLRGWRLDFPPKIYFDEQYYFKAANDYLDGRQDSNTVHPPLGKIQIAAGTLLVDGLKYHGWLNWPDSASRRVAGVLAGTAMIPLTYLLALLLSRGSTGVAAMAGFFLATDFLHLVTSRICMLDPFMAFWSLLGMFLAARFCFERPTFSMALGAALAFGVATACKWNGLFGAAAALLCMTDLRVPYAPPRPHRKLRMLLPPLFALCILVVYVAAYIPFFIKAKSAGPEAWTKIIGYHKTMVKFRYNDKKFQHQYLSAFYEWPLIMRPIWYYYHEHKETDPSTDKEIKLVEGIAAMGSPVFWWVAAFFLLEATVIALKDANPVGCFLVLNYLFNWGLWAISTTGGFFYYMLPLTPIMAVTVALCLESWGESRSGRWLRAAFLVAVALAFVMYFPLLTGLTVPEPYFRRLFFIPSWI